MIEFKEWPKIARLNRDMVITEKIDGTNAAVGLVQLDEGSEYPHGATMVFTPIYAAELGLAPTFWALYAQSRSRLITPGDDNFGFAAWVQANAEDLALTLGEGLHFGEWWGSGIQRGYGLPKGERRFSLFNTPRYGDTEKFDLTRVEGLSTVPVLWQGAFDTEVINYIAFTVLPEHGSYAADFDNPEGVVAFHTAANLAFKVTCKNDEVPKAVADKSAKASA